MSALQGTKRLVESVEMERYSGCEFCKAPQAICGLWQKGHMKNARGFSRSRHGRCQFEGVLEVACAALLAFRMKDEVEEWVKKEAEKEKAIRYRKRGEIWMGEVEEEMTRDGEGAKKWLGRKVSDSKVDMSGLCQILSELG